MPPPSPRDEAVARRVAARCPGLLATAVELREHHRWSLARIVSVLGVTSEQTLLRRCAAEQGPAPTCRVLCSRCKWTGLRPRPMAPLRPCPKCGSLVRRGRLRPGRPPVAERLGVEATVLTVAYVSPRAWARLRAVAGSRSAEAAGLVLERWARGEGVPEGWVPELGKPKRCNREKPPEKVLLQAISGADRVT